MKNIKNFLWGTFNYRNKGMKWINRIQTGYHYMRISRDENYKRNY